MGYLKLLHGQETSLKGVSHKLTMFLGSHVKPLLSLHRHCQEPQIQQRIPCADMTWYPNWNQQNRITQRVSNVGKLQASTPVPCGKGVAGRTS